MRRKILTIYALEELNDVAEYIVSSLQFNGYQYDEQGNHIYTKWQKNGELEKRFEAWRAGAKANPLCFRENERLRTITFADALDMPLKEIKKEYLGQYMPMLRVILRKGTMECGVVPSEEIPDSYLDDLLALRWRENLKMWAMQWDQKENRNGNDAS
mgnify:CR=1 FL=1